MAIYRGPGGPGDATTDATAEATVATTKAGEASASATAAASSATTALNSATTATTQAGIATAQATSATASATSATSSETNASTSATNAANSATSALSAEENAEIAQTAAETAATSATSSASTATTKASEASTSATNAATSAASASTSATSAAASYDSFDDRYLGAKSSAPTVDNDGDALLTGALYWNTTLDQLYLWDGAAWNAAAFTAEGAVTSFNTRTGAVTLSSGDVTTALGYTPSTVANLNDVSDVTITSAVNGQVLKYNGSAWVNGTDIDTDTYVGSSWYTTTNNAGNWDTAFGWGNHASAGYLTSFTETNDLTSAVTWANVPDANITQSSVTQHQAALSITESQISDLAHTTSLAFGSITSTPTTLSGYGITDAQAFDADTAKTDVTQTYTAPQRGTTTTDNDLSFDMNVTNNFSCTPSTGGTLTFTNHTAGQSGYVLLDNTAGVAITAHANTKINATDLATISTAGVYLVSYFDNGTNAYITVSAAYP